MPLRCQTTAAPLGRESGYLYRVLSYF